jgi:hypothetical protein
MVTYFCNNCGQYLKKKQGDSHGYCSLKLTCTLCKKDFEGYTAIRGHTDCHPIQPKRVSKIEKEKTKTLDLSRYQWKGFKNTLRRVVRESKDKKIEKELLKRSFEVLFKEKGNSSLNYKFAFEKKLQKARNLVKEGEFVCYRKN